MLIVVEPLEAGSHDDPGHPERPARIGAAMLGVDDLHLGDDLLVVGAEPAPVEHLVRVHTPGHLDRLERLSAAGGGPIDQDTYTSHTSWHDARMAAGTKTGAPWAAAAHGAPVFVPARPPGHHAVPDRAGTKTGAPWPAAASTATSPAPAAIRASCHEVRLV